MDLFQAQSNDSTKITESLGCEINGEIITTEECKKCLGKYDLTDQRISAIKDNLIGVVDSLINSYLEDFR